MAKRNTGKKKFDYNPMKMEKEMAKIHRLINEQNFESKKDFDNYLNSIMGDKINEFKTKSDPKYEAQDLVYEAYELPENKGKKLIERALKIDPNNADAYVYLAEIEEDNHKALELYEKGVKAGKKSLGEEVFKEDAGHFWGIFETRPYMRARVGYAECLYLIGRCNEAIDQYKDMLKLNPNDNQGIRFHLSTWLIDQNRKNDYLKLYHKFNDEISAHWLFNHVLFLFKTIGKVKKTS
ncbi:MAG: tetratricopeptide repeat protein, partial [Candidatus Marinimicrobia bacterium]|nr:tetratricopeptide repeat protein [Candidatus Neomarinimicrobiota bacterium]